MKTIEIVVHCFAEKRPEFAKLLTAQLSSLIAFPPKVDVSIRVITSREDEATQSACFGFRNQCYVGFCGMYCGSSSSSAYTAESDAPRQHSIVHYWLPHDWLFRRSIGRNLLARQSTADIVWFADADYIFGPGCLDALAASDFKGLAYPREVQIHRAHWLGDKEIERIKIGEVFEPDLTLFEPKREKFAIGGLQIVDGDSARKYGYLDGTKWTLPVPDATDFLDTKEDKAYRAFMNETVGPSTVLDLPNLYRFRHSTSAFEPSEKRLAQTAHKS